MHRHAAFLIAAASLAGATVAIAGPRHYALPEETAVLLPGPGLEAAQANCGGCHSADYVTTQPRGLANPKAFWSAEVTKMQKAYGAPVEASDAAVIVDYLVQTYSR